MTPTIDDFQVLATRSCSTPTARSAGSSSDRTGSCCELIWSEAGRVCEVEDPADAYHPPGDDYPDHYDVALDVQTGVVVRCLPVGGAPDSPSVENDILEVDGAVRPELRGQN